MLCWRLDVFEIFCDVLEHTVMNRAALDGTVYVARTSGLLVGNPCTGASIWCAMWRVQIQNIIASNPINNGLQPRSDGIASNLIESMNSTWKYKP